MRVRASRRYLRKVPRRRRSLRLGVPARRLRCRLRIERLESRHLRFMSRLHRRPFPLRGRLWPRRHLRRRGRKAPEHELFLPLLLRLAGLPLLRLRPFLLLRFVLLERRRLLLRLLQLRLRLPRRKRAERATRPQNLFDALEKDIERAAIERAYRHAIVLIGEARCFDAWDEVALIEHY